MCGEGPQGSLADLVGKIVGDGALDHRVALVFELLDFAHQAQPPRPMGEIGIFDRAPAHVVVEHRQQLVDRRRQRRSFGQENALAKQGLQFTEHRGGGAGRLDADPRRRGQRRLIVALDRARGRGVEAAGHRCGLAVEAQGPGRDVPRQVQVRRGVGPRLAEAERLAGQLRLAALDFVLEERSRFGEPGVRQVFEASGQGKSGLDHERYSLGFARRPR